MRSSATIVGLFIATLILRSAILASCWLLLHFDDGDRIAGRRGCINRLKYLPACDKSVRSLDISLDTIKARSSGRRSDICLRETPACPARLGQQCKPAENIQIVRAKETESSTDHPLHCETYLQDCCQALGRRSKAGVEEPKTKLQYARA